MKTSLDYFFAVLWLLPLFVLLGLVLRQRIERLRRIRRASRYNHQLMAYHEQINTRRHLYTRRGSAMIDTVIVLAFCLVIALTMAACLSDIDLMAQP